MHMRWTKTHMSMTQDGPNKKIQVETLLALEIGIDIDYYYYAAA